MGIRGVIDLGQLARTMFRSGKKTSMGRWKKESPCRRSLILSKRNKGGSTRPVSERALFDPLPPEQNGGSSHKGLPKHRAWLVSFCISERGSTARISSARGIESE